MKKAILGLCAVGALTTPAVQAESALFPAISLVTGILNVGVFPQSDNYTTDDDIIIMADDGVELAANVFVPTFTSGPMPAVVFINSWAMNEYEYLTEAARFAEEGYVVLSYSTRGFGQSGGLIDTAGPLDMADLSNVLDYLIANFNVDPQRIGTAGISYGSGISMLGAAYDSRVKAVAAMSTWGSLREALYAQETPRKVWGELLTLSSQITGRPDPIIQQTWEDVQERRNLDAVYAWTDQRSPINFVDQINANGTAVYISQNWGDNLFQVNSVLEMFTALDVPKHIDLQPGTHAGAEIGGLLGDGDTHVLNNMHRWFAEHLKGDADAMEGQLPVGMKVKFQDGYQQYSDYPVAEASTQTFYLKPRTLFSNGALDDSPFQSWTSKDNTINSLVDTVATTAIPLASQMFEQMKLPVIASIPLISRVNGITFIGDRLSNTMAIRGKPELSIMVQPKASTVQLVAYLYDMDALGTGKLITHAPVTLHDVTPGDTLRVNLPLTATAYDIPAGHKLVLAIDTQDLLYAKPDGGAYNVDFEFRNKQQSTLKIPAL